MTDAPGGTPAAAPGPQAPTAVSPAVPDRGGAQLERKAIADGHYEGLPPAEQDKYSRVRKVGPDGGSEWVERASLDVKPGEPGKPTGPINAADGKITFGEMEFTEEGLREVLTWKGAEDLRRASLPATPEDYKLDLPKDFVIPQGVEFAFKQDAPELADAKRWAHANGLSQEQFSGMLSLYAAEKVKETAFFQNARKAEVEKLGNNGTARVTAVETWLRGIVGDELAGDMRNVMATEKIVRGWERIMARFSNQGAAPFSQAHRTPAEPRGRVSEEEFNRMSPGARLDYTRQFDQRQFTEGNRG